MVNGYSGIDPMIATFMPILLEALADDALSVKCAAVSAVGAFVMQGWCTAARWSSLSKSVAIGERVCLQLSEHERSIMRHLSGGPRCVEFYRPILERLQTFVGPNALQRAYLDSLSASGVMDLTDLVRELYRFARAV